MKKQTWKEIKGFTNYFISINGIVKKVKNGKEKILKHFLNEKGYPSVGLYNNSIQKIRRVHKLLAIAFIPNPLNKPFINHKNGIKADFSIKNLEWCTYNENSIHAHKNGLNSTKMAVNSNKKPIIQKDLNGNFVKRFESMSEAVRQTGINNVKQAALGKQKSAGNYLWEYENQKLVSKQIGSFDEEGFGITRVIYDKKEDSKITRLEVIDHSPQGEGRAYIQHGIKELQLSYQDDGKTLKIFIK